MAGPRSGHDYNVKILRSLSMYVEHHHGRSAIARMCTAGGIRAEDLDGRSHWVASSQLNMILEVARSYLASDEEFRLANTYNLAEAYGPIRFALRAAAPISVYKQALERFSVICTIGHHEIVSSTRNSMHCRWIANPPVSRLVCLIRQGQAGALPTLWGLPAAKFEEEGCMANGDPYCGYKLQWYEKPHWFPTIAGAAAGGASGLLAMRFGYVGPLEVAAFTAIAGLIGHLKDLYSAVDANRDTDQQMIDALEKASAKETEARNEMLDLHKSERDWSRMLEEESRDKTAAVHDLTEHFSALEKNRSDVVRGYSHDLRNPLQVLRLGSGYLRTLPAAAQDDTVSKVLDEIDWSVQQMNQLLTDLNRIVSKPTGTGQLNPQDLAVPLLTEKVRRRLAALAYGSELRPSVFSTREAPASIKIDPLVFDRVVDNLLTNAVKYTHIGSIVVEMDGSPGFLVVKVSDTGRGIAAEDLERTFSPGGSDETSRAANSLGVGLSVVVHLLAQIGGRLEIMSKPQFGTTIWLHLPVESKLSQPLPDANTKSDIALVKKVVSIRRAG